MVLLAGTAWADFGDPLGGLTAAERARFTAGRQTFKEVEGVADGLGPVFNADSCAACHNVGATGGGSERVETRFGRTVSGAFDPMTSQGGSLIQAQGIGAQGVCTFVGEQVPAEATIRARRRTTPLFGLGLVDSVPGVALVALAAHEARSQPATAGRPNLVTDVVTGRQAVGKFGWKSQVPNLLHFSADAYVNEMGITSPFFRNENCPQGDCSLLACDPVADPEDDGTDVRRFNDFMRLLAPPPRPRLDCAGFGGSLVFERIGCASCHVRTLVTGPSPVEALRFRAFQRDAHRAPVGPAARHQVPARRTRRHDRRRDPRARRAGPGGARSLRRAAGGGAGAAAEVPRIAVTRVPQSPMRGRSNQERPPFVHPGPFPQSSRVRFFGWSGSWRWQAAS